MATSKEEREILESFYQKNKNLMNAIIEMMMDDDDVDPTLKATMSTVVSTRDYSKYEFDGSVYSKNQLVLAVIKKYVSDRNPINFTALETAFPKKLQGSSGVVKKYDDLSDNEKKYRRFFNDTSDIVTLADGTQCAVCTQWGVGNIDAFIEKAKEHGYTIAKA
jgi:hypothetical protein